MTLTPEQEFRILSFAQEVSEMSEEVAKEVLIEKFEELVRMDAYYKQKIGSAWGIEGFAEMG
jgi:hypothetical protein